jgi:hypothetical protein
VQLVEIGVIGLESLEAGFTAFDDVESTVPDQVWLVGHTAVDLGCEENLITLAVALKCFANELFGCAFAVDVGGVEEVDSLADGVVDDLAGVFEVDLLAEHHAAQHEWAYVDAGASK